MAEQEKLLPCPNPECCEGTVVFGMNDKGDHFIECISCDMRGPTDNRWTDAKLAWNALPRPDAVEEAKEVAKLRVALAKIANWREWPRAGPVAVLLDVEQIASAALKEGEG